MKKIFPILFCITFFIGIIVPLKISTASIEANGLIAYFPFDGDANNVVNVGYKGVVYGATLAQGKIYQAYEFNGTDSYIDYGDNSTIDGINKLTVSAWIKINALPITGKVYVPIGKDANGKPSYRIVITSAGNVHFAVATTNNGWYSAGTTATCGSSCLSVNNWYNIVGTYDGNVVKIYVNGQYKAQGVQTISGSIVNGTASFHFGRGGYANTIDYFKGTIDESKIYNYALNNQEIQSEYNKTFSNYVPEPRLVSTDYLLGTFYMPSWKMGTHLGWQSISSYPDRKPLLGYYDEGSPEVADWEIKWAKEHGISFFIYDWYRSRPRAPEQTENITQEPITKNSIYLGHAIDALYNSRYKNQFQFSIMVTSSVYNRAVYSMTDLENNLMPFLINNYFKDPNYLKINNKPVLFIYDDTTIKERVGGTEEDMKGALDKMREVSRNAGFGGLIILGRDDPTDLSTARDGMTRLQKEGYDYVFTYRWWIPQKNPGSQYIINHQLEMLNYWKENANILPFVPTVTTASDASPLIDMQRRYFKDYIWRLAPDGFKTVLENARGVMNQVPTDKLGSKMIIIDNWNEYSEGDYLAPTSQYKFGYLQSVRDVFTKKDNIPDYRLPEQIGLGPYDSFYQDWINRLNTHQLVTHYKFEGNAFDSSDEKNDATVHGATLVAGKIGQAYHFDGVDDYIEFTNPYRLLGQNQITFGGWMKSTSINGTIAPFGIPNSYRAVINSDGSGHCVVATKNNLWYGVGTTASWKKGIIAPSIWHQIICVYNGSNVVAYVDGKQVAISSGNISGWVSPSLGPSLLIGSGGGANFFTGAIDEVKVWNYALTNQEILNEYNSAPVQICVPNWQCASWSNCTNSQQTRTCTDLNNCGVTTNKPAETQSCTPTCTPSCNNKQCGDNGCGGTCGSCASGTSCNTNGQCIAPAPTLVLSASLTSINSGGSSILTWSSTNATSCSATTSPENTQWTGAKEVSSSQVITNITTNTSLALTCTGSGGITTKSATVNLTTIIPTTYTLSISKLGSGTVTGTNISCGTDCFESYNSGTSVTLAVTPSTGSTFAGWSGDCLGTGTCTLTMNVNKNITAVFNIVMTPTPPTPSPPGGGGGGGSISTPTTTTPTIPIAQMTRDQLVAEVNRIIALIAQLQIQLAQLKGTTTPQLFTTNLYYGTTDSPEVKRLQEFLINNKYMKKGYNSGNYSIYTVNALKYYQRVKGILITGNFGPTTRARVNEELGK